MAKQSKSFASITPFSTEHGAWSLVDGKLTKLKGGGGLVSGITDDGRVAGSLKSGAAVVWKTAGAEPTRLAVPDGAEYAQVHGIDQDGTVAGYGNSDADTRAVFWLPGGGTREVPVADGQTSPYMVGFAGGWVAGADSRNGYRYNVRTDTYEKLPALGIRPVAVGTDGTVVSGDGNPTETFHAIAGGSARKLASNSTATSYNILGVSDDGRTVTGNQYDRGAEDPADGAGGRTVTWTCG